MTSSHTDSIRELKKELNEKIADAVELLQLPYVGLSDYVLPSDITRYAVILCHSVQHRRLAITDLEDAFYVEFLEQCKQKISKNHQPVSLSLYKKILSIISTGKNQPIKKK